MTPPRTLFRLGGVSAKDRATIMRGFKSNALDALAPLTIIASQFQAVGRWTADEWAGLTPEERFACLEAHEQAVAREARRIATLVGLSVRRAGQAEELAAEFDGGALREEAAVSAALEEHERAAQSVPRSRP